MFDARTDAGRYEAGHVGYLGHCSVHDGLEFTDRLGLEAACDHSLRLRRRLEEQLDPDRYQCISPHWRRSPIISFLARDGATPERRSREPNVVITLTGHRPRVSPAVYGDQDDIDRLTEALNAGGRTRLWDLLDWR